jgi:hypothetical protein
VIFGGGDERKSVNRQKSETTKINSVTLGGIELFEYTIAFWGERVVMVFPNGILKEKDKHECKSNN